MNKCGLKKKVKQMDEENQPSKVLKLDEDQNAGLSKQDAEPEPPILKINDDCLGEIFDYLSLRDLCSVGRTCKHLQQVAGQYFNLNYPMEAISFMESMDGTISQHINDNGNTYETNFGRYAQKIEIGSIYGCIPDICNYIAKNINQNLKHIELDTIFARRDGFNFFCMKDILKNIQALRTKNCVFHQDNFDYMLQFCSNLKQFKLHNRHETTYPCDCPQLPIPSLQSMEIFFMDKNEVKTFIQANPQIKMLSLKADGNDSEAEMIEEVDLELDELVLAIKANHECDHTVYSRLIAAKETGKFKRLHATIYCHKHRRHNINYKNHIKNITCVDSLTFQCHGPTVCTNFSPPNLASLTNLKELCINVNILSFGDFDPLARALINLEVLRMHNGFLEHTIPFARRLSKLRLIQADKKSSNIKFNISSLNNDRKKLREARKLIIRLGKEAFLKVRWESVNLRYEMVEIRRATKQCDKCWL